MLWTEGSQLSPDEIDKKALLQFHYIFRTYVFFVI